MPTIKGTKKRKTSSNHAVLLSSSDDMDPIKPSSRVIGESDCENDLKNLPREQWPLKAFCTIKPISGETFKMRKRSKVQVQPRNENLDDVDEVTEQMQIIDGKIVVTDTRAQTAELVDEKDEYINEKSFQKKSSRTGWSKAESIKFYKLLSLMGTDFGLIAGALNNKTRIQVRNKYKIEERKNPLLMNLCLSRKEFINTQEFAKLCGCDIEEIEKYRDADIPVPRPYYKVMEEQEKNKEVVLKKSKKLSNSKKQKQNDEDNVEVVGQVEFSSESESAMLVM
eukprot:NODE_223_length_13915_cov_0.128257.p8 type:complete len:281 gc:universal NODE_223_length_13915_cov_0.128257:2840-1998(-)